MNIFSEGDLEKMTEEYFKEQLKELDKISEIQVINFQEIDFSKFEDIEDLINRINLTLKHNPLKLSDFIEKEKMISVLITNDVFKSMGK
jgi:hypothetical protein